MVVGCQPLAGESMRWLKHTVSGLANPHDAAAKNRLAKMEKYVQQGGDVNKPNKLGDTPLHEACAYIRDNGDSSKGKRRKGKGVGKDRRKVGKKLTRRQMGEGGPLEMLELLLRAGSNINAQNIVGDAPLHKAALNGRALSADYLIRAGANVNIRNEFAQTPLHAACVSGNIEVVQRLVQGGADTGAQDAAEDTPFHEACRHQYESISIYLMGLVNNPETSQGLKLWEGLDPSWEKMLRSRAQACVEDGTEEDVSTPRDMSTAAAASGLSSVRLGVTTPSTTHNSLMSSESAMGLGVSNRTPARRDVFSTSGNRDRGGGGRDTAAPTREKKMMMPPRGEAASTKGSTKERKMMSAQSAAQVQPGVHHQRTTTRNRGSDSAAPAAGAGMNSADGARVDSTRSGSRPSSATRRRRRSREGDATPGETSPRVFSNGAADVLAWQATKVKSAKQGRLIERAREALRETEHEAEMARSRSMTSLGDDEGSIDTCNTADSPTTVGSRSSRPGEGRQRRAISPAAKPAETLEVSGVDADDNPQSSNADAAADLSDAESQPSRESRRVKPAATNGTGVASATAAAAAAEAAADDARGRAVSPVVPTPPRAEGRDDVGGHAPPRQSGRRQSARLAKGQVVSVRSPVARVSRRPSGFSKADDVDGSSRRSSRRGSSSRSATMSSAAVGSGEGGGDAGGSRRSSGGSRSSRGPSDHGQSHNRCGLEESRSAMAAAAEPAAAARPRRSKEEGVRAENGEGGGGRSPSARRERHRLRGEDATGVGGRSSPSGGGDGGSSSRRKSRSSRGEGGESSSRKSVGGGSGSSSSRRRDTKVTSSSSSSRRSQREGSDGQATTALATTQAPAPASSSPAHSRATTAAVAATSVPKAPHESRSHSGAREGRASSSRAKERRGTSSRTKEGRERRTPAASSPGGRLYATAPRQRPSSPDLCPPTWASNVPSSTLEDASHKRVVASDFPARRVVSPYNSRKWEPPAGGRRTRSSASPTRSSSPERRSALPPPASRPVEKEIDPEGEDPEREAAVNDNSHASSFPTETVGDSVSLPEAATAAAEAKPVATFDSAVPEAASARKTCEAKPTTAANGVATAAAVEDGVVQESPATSSAASAKSEGPPLIDALLMEKKAATDVDSTAARADKEEGLRHEREDRASCTASTKSNPTRSFTAIETSKSIVFSDSDSELDNGGSTSGSNESPKECPTSGGDVQPMAALSAVSTVFARQRSGDKKGENAVLGNKQADSSSSSSVSGAVSAEVVDSDRKADGPAASVSRLEEAGAGDRGETATTASKEDRQGLPSYQDALAAGAASAAAAAAVPRPVRPDAGPEAVEDGAAAAAEGEGRGTVEPSSAPQNCLRPFSSSTIPSTMAVLAGGGGGGGRPRSAALGRPGMPTAKVTMPIAGGRAAWNKFLATTAQGGSEKSAAAADGDGEREEKEGGEASSAEGEAGVGASGSKAGDAVAAGSGNHAATLAAKGPRGFTNPAQSQDGPNKGPAGAFSGNSMWRLAGGTAAGAGRARSGVAANGHGGYSNPLAAMRAAGSGGGAETSSGGGGGGGVANPLSGLRGAASMSGAGVSNPLARGRGPRAGGRRVGGMANPMLRSGGGGDVGGHARGTGGGVSPFSSSVGTTGRTAPPPPPPRDDEGSLSPGPATMPPLSSSPMEMGGAPAIPAAMSWGPSPSYPDTTTAAAGNDGDATEAAASTGGGEGNAAMRRGGGSERPPTEFRAIGSNGSWPTDGALVPPRRRAAAREAQPHSVTERDPGQEKVGGLVKALQHPDASRLRLMLQNTHNPDLSASGSSLSNLGEKGLVQLRRAKYSPRPAVPGLLDAKETEVDA